MRYLAVFTFTVKSRWPLPVFWFLPFLDVVVLPTDLRVRFSGSAPRAVFAISVGGRLFRAPFLAAALREVLTLLGLEFDRECDDGGCAIAFYSGGYASRKALFDQIMGLAFNLWQLSIQTPINRRINFVFPTG